MSQTERDICARLKHFREGIGWGQKEFANQLGASFDQIVSFEYQRTRLSYQTAWNIREIFGLSLTWLSTGYGPPNERDLDPWPKPNSFHKTAVLLSEVMESLRFQDLNSPAHKEQEKLWFKDRKNKPPFKVSRSILLSILKDNLVEWMARIPEDKIEEFATEIIHVGQSFADNFSDKSDVKIAVRTRALIWGEMREEIRKRLLPKTSSDLNLTNSATSLNLASVKNQWPALKRKLQETTADTGSKSRLAKFLGVDLTRVSQWLTDSKTSAREPGAEYALQMQYWVEHPECQK
jgi:transcriptional regulator with XRE-family HTH domain